MKYMRYMKNINNLKELKIIKFIRILFLMILSFSLLSFSFTIWLVALCIFIFGLFMTFLITSFYDIINFFHKKMFLNIKKIKFLRYKK